MRTHSENRTTPSTSPSWLAFLLRAGSFLACGAALITAHAKISEPDNLIYGTITISNVPITAARTDVVIEARRTTDGPAIASYRMGSNPALGNFYSLTIPLESVAPLANTNASAVGDSLFITLLEGASLRGQTGFLVTDRGSAERIDFGAAVIDGDGDSLPDAWELLHFAGLGANTNSPGANGQTAWQHYLAGTDPNDTNDGFRLHLTQSNNLKNVSFVARRAEGPGYEGMTRLYTLESQADLANPVWAGVSGYIAVPGDNQTVVYQTAGSTGMAFFRGKITLQPGSGTSANDTDGDSLPDAWELNQFGNLNQSASSLNANGQTALQNYVAGTAVNTPTSVFKLSSTLNGNNRIVTFNAVQAQGIGYEGKQRFYTLESSPSPTGPWQAVGGFVGILATNQTVSYQSASQPLPIFYRARVWLQP
ncbi:MAG TPA: hypothetical protein VFZ59_02435 [Verrucomicrobiae bacterium]|nr:hypothetical protein [Verrucomicrobiae bacterium]